MTLYISSWLFATKHCDNIKMLFYHSCFLFVSLTMLLGPWTNEKWKIWKIFNFTHACLNITLSRLDKHIINMPHGNTHQLTTNRHGHVWILLSYKWFVIFWWQWTLNIHKLILPLPPLECKVPPIGNVHE
jgi:hypothetical protein